jgi:hypothetical protein
MMAPAQKSLRGKKAAKSNSKQQKQKVNAWTAM